MAAPDSTTRIISHMNKDHGDSVVRYLEHYHSVPSPKAQFGRLTEVGLSHMTVKALGSRYVIPFDPPMKDHSEARTRLVAMDQDSIRALGRDPVTIKKYTLPHGFQWAVFFACLFTYALFGRRDTLTPGPDSFLRPLADRYPGVFAWLYKIRPQVYYPMIAIHVFETSLLAYTKLAKHSVPMFSPLWLKWTFSCFIEGFGCFLRINEMVKEEKDRKANAKH